MLEMPHSIGLSSLSGVYGCLWLAAPVLCMLHCVTMSWFVQVVSSLANPIEEHMMGEDEEDQDQPGACCSHDHDHSQTHTHHDNGKPHQHANGRHAELANGGEADEEEEEDEEEEGNSEDEENGSADLVFPAAYGLALAELLSSHHSPIRVADIKLPNAELQLDLAVTLWKEGIVCVKSSSNQKPSKKSRK